VVRWSAAARLFNLDALSTGACTTVGSAARAHWVHQHMSADVCEVAAVGAATAKLAQTTHPCLCGGTCGPHWRCQNRRRSCSARARSSCHGLNTAFRAPSTQHGMWQLGIMIDQRARISMLPLHCDTRVGRGYTSEPRRRLPAGGPVLTGGSGHRCRYAAHPRARQRPPCTHILTCQSTHACAQRPSSIDPSTPTSPPPSPPPPPPSPPRMPLPTQLPPAAAVAVGRPISEPHFPGRAAGRLASGLAHDSGARGSNAPRLACVGRRLAMERSLSVPPEPSRPGPPKRGSHVLTRTDC
jgi:hypothetical protein